MAPKGRRKKVSFFSVPSLPYFLIIPLMILATVIPCAPDLLPYGRLGFLGTFLHYMAYDLNHVSVIICVAAWIAHFAESAYAYSKCRKLHLSNNDTFKWTVQTFLLGIPSLKLLQAKRKAR